MTISWDLIRSFEAVAEEGSLSGASRKLGLTQPTVGRHIDLLEDALSLALFVRGREGMTLTPKGSDLVTTAHSMKSSAAAFELRAAGLDESISGTVRISANEIFGVLVLPRILPAFTASHPGIEIEVVVSNSAANLSRRDADIAVRMFRPVQNDLIARKVADLPLGLFAHADYLARNGEPVGLSDLKSHQVIGFDRETLLIEAAAALGLALTATDFAFRCDSILAQFSAIRSGLGIGVTHLGLARDWQDVQRVLPEVALPPLPLWLACHADIRFNARTRLVMDFLAERLSNPYD